MNLSFLANNMSESNIKCPFINPEKIFGDFADARKTNGLVYSEELKAWVVSRYDDIIQALLHPDIFSSDETVPHPVSPYKEIFENRVPTRGTLFGLDNPDHDRLRMSISSFLLPRHLEKFEPVIRSEANALFDEFVAEGRTNLKTAFALLLPLKIITIIV